MIPQANRCVSGHDPQCGRGLWPVLGRVKFGRDNVLILSTYLVQMMEPFSLGPWGSTSAFKGLRDQVARALPARV